MRHNRKRVLLSRPTKVREALMRNLATSLVLHDRIVTTTAKARILKVFIEKLVTIAKKDDQVTAIRKLNAVFYDEKATRRMLEVIKPQMSSRSSGFVRLRKKLPRVTDAAPQIEVSFVS
ncbi:MAG: 50S ribosomal protein L17 [Candidatus Abawacabacteria bacterium]|nr:50S ribosomal protein L17 [Candidatus Abawacabacteria bacterium]